MSWLWGLLGGHKDDLVEQVVDLVGSNLDAWDNTPQERQSLRALYQHCSVSELQRIHETLGQRDEDHQK